MRTLVIGCGNPVCGDDAAGPLVARRLRALGVDAIEATGDLLGLLDRFSQCERAIIIDIVQANSPPGDVMIWDARNAPLTSTQFRTSTHGFGVPELIELARALDRLPEEAWIVGIAGERFEPGTEPSEAVIRGVERAAQQVLCMKPA